MTSTGPGWVGKTLSNRYKIEAILGRGGMSSVYRAHDPNLNRKVAVKIIHQHLTDNAEFVQRFEQEAALIAQLRHPNIIQVHDFNHDGNTYYMVMEYIAGETLSHRLEALKNAGIRLPLPDTVRIMSRICDAVDFAHQHRMIHRDLKPANVMLDLLGEPTLMDFGIARLVGSKPTAASGLPMGTAAYMSPELVRGEDADHRADIYSLGIMLYEMLSGEPPFHDDSTYQVMFKHVNEPVPDLQAMEMNTPHSLVTIVERALAKEANGRFQSAAEMRSALQTIGLQLQGPGDNLATRHLDRLGLMWQQAHDLYDEREWISCINKLDDLRRTDADYQHQKVSALRLQAINKLAKQAERDYATSKFVESLAAIEALRNFDPDFPINELEFKVQMGIQQADLRALLDSLYRQAVAFLEARDYEKALARWESIQLQKETIEFQDKFMVEKRAKEGLCTALYTEALAALTNQEPQLALAKMERIRQVNPSFPDSQNVSAKAKQMAAAPAPSSRQRRYGLGWGALILLLLLIAAAVFLPRFLGDETAVANPSPNTFAALETATSAASSTTPATNTAQPTATASATATSTVRSAGVATSSPVPSSPTTSPPTSTLPFATEPATYQATVIENITLFAQPDVNAAEVTIIEAAENVWVLGRSETGNWLFVSDNLGQRQGFAIAERIEWTGDISRLPVRDTVVASAEPTIQSTPISGELRLNLYELLGTERCTGEAWAMQVFIQGQGGNGRYNYYWNDQLLIENTTEGFAFEVSSGGGPIIGNGRVTSGSTLTAEKELFLTRPNC